MFCFLIVKLTFLQNWPNVPVPGIIRLVPGFRSHLTPIYASLQFVGSSWPCQCSLSSLRRNTNFGFHNNLLWTGGMGHGLRYQRIGSEHSGCDLPALPSAEEWHQKRRADPPSHVTQVLSKRDLLGPLHTCAIKTKVHTLFSLLPPANSSHVCDTLCSQWCGQRQKIHQLVCKTWSKSNNTLRCDQGHQKLLRKENRVPFVGHHKLN